jgi:hypothetical protein
MVAGDCGGAVHLQQIGTFHVHLIDTFALLYLLSLANRRIASNPSTISSPQFWSSLSVPLPSSASNFDPPYAPIPHGEGAPPRVPLAELLHSGGCAAVSTLKLLIYQRPSTLLVGPPCGCSPSASTVVLLWVLQILQRCRLLLILERVIPTRPSPLHRCRR